MLCSMTKFIYVYIYILMTKVDFLRKKYMENIDVTIFEVFLPIPR